MAARLEPKNGRPWTPERVRERIRVGLLVKRLQRHALGKLEMTKTEIAAARILLGKSMPDLSSIDTTLRGDASAPILISSTDGKL
jgi:hypothetical protein